MLAQEIFHQTISLHDRVGIGRRQVINVGYFQFGTENTMNIIVFYQEVQVIDLLL